MKRRQFPLALVALAAACKEATAPHEVTVSATMGVSVFPGWETPRSEYGTVPGTQSPYADPWKAMRTNDRVPLLGEYNEADPIITQRRCEMMEYGRIGFACYQVEMKKAA
jgi:hypothetical protein